MKHFRLTILALLALACTRIDDVRPIQDLERRIDDCSASKADIENYAATVGGRIRSIQFVPAYDYMEAAAVVNLIDDAPAEVEDVQLTFEVMPSGTAAKIARIWRDVLNVNLQYPGADIPDCNPEIKSVTADGDCICIILDGGGIDSRLIERRCNGALTLSYRSPNGEYHCNSVELSALQNISLRGTRILDDSNVYGLISESGSGKGIAGVKVTDGFSYTVTDAAGVYQMHTHSRCRKVYFTIPADCRVPLDPETHIPAFYSPGAVDCSRTERYDFKLEKQAVENNFTLMMIGDPQCSKTATHDRYVNESIADMKTTLNYWQPKGRYCNCYAVTLGDITSDSTDMWPAMKESMSNVALNSGWLPFFQCMGNHDHNSLVSDPAKANFAFNDTFGPQDYSFDRGKAHIIVMDDVMVTQIASSSAPNKATWNYNAGFNEDQYKWLEQDISLVEDREHKMAVICMHIPVRAGSTSGGSNINQNAHYDDLLRLLASFGEAHIMIGHTHNAQNYIHTGYVCKGGLPVYEHVHGAACGSWWSCNSNCSGAPNGYSLYEVEGATMKDWVAKGTNRDINYQVRVFDGNQTWGKTNGYLYNWYTASNKGGSANIVTKGNTVLKDCIVAEVWNDEAVNWSVAIYKDGKKAGDMVRIPDGQCGHISIAAYYFNELNKNSSSYSGNYSHFWYFKPGGAPSDYKGWEVRATQHIPGSTTTHTYTCNRLTTDYSEY